MPVETMASNNAWPSLNESHGNVLIPTDESTSNNNGNEWEMIADNEAADTLHGNNRHIVILNNNGDISNPKEISGRPRSATVGGDSAAIADGSNKLLKLKEHGSFGDSLSRGSDAIRSIRRTLRRCASTPDLLVSDNDHEVIVEDESDEEEEATSSDEIDLYEEGESVEDETVEGDVVRVQKTKENCDRDDSFEVVSERNSDGKTDDQEGSEPVMVDEDVSMDASAWTMASAPTPAAPVATGAWGSKSTPSFRDILAKNADKTMSWGNDKAQTEAMLRDSHRRHHLRVRTKPKFIVADDANGQGKLKHAHSTGDLSKMMEMAEQERKNACGKRMKKQFSALMEEDDDGDFVIGRGSGGVGGGEGGSGGGMNTSDIMGDTDAMDYYHRKDKGSQSTHNKKKERPDEAKRKEISMYKKELQREKQQAKGKCGGGGGKKKENKQVFGGKKERRRL